MKWQADHKRWENNRVTVRKAKDLLNDWVCEGIAIELEEHRDPVSACKYINKRYKVSDDRARELLLDKVSGTRLGDFANMTEYVNKHRQLKADLKKAKHTYTDSQFVTNVLHGLPETSTDNTTGSAQSIRMIHLISIFFSTDCTSKKKNRSVPLQRRKPRGKPKKDKSKDNDKSKEKHLRRLRKVGTYRRHLIWLAIGNLWSEKFSFGETTGFCVAT
jgi:hypothetical protein